MSIIDTLKHTALTDRLLRRPPGLYDYARRTIARVSALAPDELATWSETRLAAILARARSLPGYAQAPASTRLTDWPILSKPQLIGREKLFATRGVLPRAAGATGGTTGQPMQVTRTAAGVVFEQATIDRLCREAGADCALSRVAVLRGDSIKDPADMSPPFWVDEGRRKRLFSAHHLNRESIGAYVKALHDFAPDILFCYPSSLGALLHALPIDAGLHIPVIFASSETLSPATGELAREMLGARIVNYYGHAERVVAAADIDNQGCRFLPFYGHVELVPDGEGLARIIATSLWDHGQIFVRYDTGDRVRVPNHDPDVLMRIATGQQAFEGIDGRSSEYIDLPNGRRIIGLNHIQRGVRGAASIQLHYIQDEGLTLYIAPTEGYGPATIAAIKGNLSLKLPPEIPARFVLVNGPVREPNGKAPLLLRRPIIQNGQCQGPELI
ncbi:MAG: hypothetical protein J0I16_22465 [Rhizobiales bacterium]|nr:hypothetical protein [Hyphomicrobiales bacterium]